MLLLPCSIVLLDWRRLVNAAITEICSKTSGLEGYARPGSDRIRSDGGVCRSRGRRYHARRCEQHQRYLQQGEFNSGRCGFQLDTISFTRHYWLLTRRKPGHGSKMPYYSKILKYWRASQGERESPENQMDVTAFRCEEDGGSIQLLDQSGRVIAEFGPGQPYDMWTLSVEYSSPR